MYENMTFENIMERCLSRVSASVDKREGSIVYDAIAPAAAELAIMYIELAYLLDRAFPDTETGDDLTKKCRERSVFRTAATYAVRKGYFEKSDGSGCDLEIGTRFSGGDINFIVTERIAAGQYSMTAETAGVVGNEYVGTLFPIDYVPDLAAARLADILIPGEDEESDDALRARYFESLESQAFGGNIADYKNKVELLPGVGAVKVFPVWNGGGTVKIVLVDSEWSVPSPELVEEVQEAIDPVGTQGTGVGLAPIGHVVTVAGVTGTTIDVSFTLTFSGSASWTTTQEAVKAAIQSYFDDLAQTFELLLTGRIDATLNAEVTYYDYMKAHPDAPIKVACLDSASTQAAIPIRKGEEPLVEAVNQALAELREDGTLTELSEKYFGTDISQEK